MKTNIVFDLIQNSIDFVLSSKKIFAVSLSCFAPELGKKCENLKLSWFRGIFLPVLILSYSPLSHCHQREHKNVHAVLNVQYILYGFNKFYMELGKCRPIPPAGDNSS